MIKKVLFLIVCVLLMASSAQATLIGAMTQDTALGLDSIFYCPDPSGETYLDRYVTMQEIIDTVIDNFIFPFDESTDAALSTAGGVHIRGDEDRISYHAGTGGEVAGEVTQSFLEHFAIPIDWTYVYDRDTTHRVKLFEVSSKVYPNGIIIDYWKVEQAANRTTGLDADLKRASDLAGTSAAVIDSLDVGVGAKTSSEDTDANINSGNAVAAGQVIYIEVSNDPVDEDYIGHFMMIFHAEED